MRQALCSLMAVWAAVASTAAAQGVVVRGEVFFPDGRTRAAAVLIEVADATGTVAARTLSDRAGMFKIELLRTGLVTVRALRVGFRPTVLANVAADTATIPLRIVLGDTPVRLAVARITTDDVCGIRTDSGAMVATAWDEVRKALASAGTVGPASPRRAEVLNWQSIHALDGSGPAWQQYSTDTLDGPRPYVGAAAEAVAAQGYARPAPGGAVDYLGPDAETLTSDAFASLHCFRLVAPPPDRPGWIGIAFRPARVGRGIVEIAGTFWIDTATAALRLLEYRYTNAPPDLARIGAGGRIEFDRLLSGEWLVRRWSIRLSTRAAIEATMGYGASPRPRPEPGHEPPLALVARLSGGTVQFVAGGGGNLLPPAAAALRARFVSTDVAAAGSTIELIEAGVFAVADSTGVATVRDVSGGRHTVLASSHAMRGLALPTIRRTVAIDAAGTRDEEFVVPDASHMLVQRCGPDAEARARAVVFGRVPAPGPDIGDEPDLRIEPLVDANRGTARERRWVADSVAFMRGDGARDIGHSLVPDHVGRWYACGIPRGATLRVVFWPSGWSRPAISFVRIDATDRIKDAGEIVAR